MFTRRSLFSLLVLSCALLPLTPALAAVVRAAVMLESDASTMGVPVSGAAVGKHLRVETDAYWRKDGQKAGAPPDGPKSLTAAIEWQDRSGDWTVLQYIEAPINGQAVLAADLTLGTPTENTYRINLLAKVPEGYQLHVDLSWELTDKAQEIEE